MKRRDFLATSALGTAGLAITGFKPDGLHTAFSAQGSKKIFVYGGGMDRKFLEYIALLTGKAKPRVCFLPTASADSPYSGLSWFRICAGLELVPFVQEMFISSYQQKKSFEEILLSMDAIVVGGGNTLNMIAIWKAQEVDKVLMKAWEKGIVLGGGSAGSLCWFEEGTTDSRPGNITKIECLGFLKGSHSPHYDAEPQRRPLYQGLISDGKLKPGYAIDNNAGIFFVDQEPVEIVSTDTNSFSYWVEASGDKAREKKLKPGRIL